MTATAAYVKSSIASLSPCRVIEDGMIFVALSAFFDGSERDGGFLTLGCVAATDKVWLPLETAWKKIIGRPGVPPCMHMTDAMSLRGQFTGWSVSDRDRLVGEFLDVLLPFRDDPQLHAFTCTVDLRAHKVFREERKLPSPERLCARIVFPHVLDWYSGLDDLVLERVDLFFDRNERFMRHIDADWRSTKLRKRYPAWEWVRSIGSAVASDTPALQIADMIAWGRNRREADFSRWAKPWEMDEHYTKAMRAACTIHGLHRPLDAAALSKGTFPEEGFEAIDPQRRKQQQDKFFRSAIIKV